jgi:ABC-type polysaccharide/polyol phosphate export permease
MRPYLTNIAITLRLMSRDRMALFFGYVFPLIFFFLFAQMMSAGQGTGLAKQVVTSVLIFGVLGNGFFGAGMRAVSDREQNILRRFKVAPTNAAPLLISWLVTGWINYLPSALFLIALGHFGYQMPWPERPFTLFVFLSVAVLAFRSLGLIIASVVNSMQESQILVQLCYLPMLFLSGATFPVSAMPVWVQILSQFIPSSHLYAGLQAILLRQEGLGSQWKSLLALVVTLAVGMLLSIKLFRWEKEEKVKSSAKLWVVAALAPFLLLGVYQAYSKESLTQAKVLQREVRRSRTVLIRDARLFIGDGRVIERGGLLIRDGRIAEVYTGESPDPKDVKAEPVEGSGKMLLPGLIDAAVVLELPGGVPAGDPRAQIEWSHAAYLYSGVTTIRAAGAASPQLTQLAARVMSGERLGSEILFGAAEGVPISLLAALEAETNPRAELLERSLVQQVAPRGLLDRTRPLLAKTTASPDALRVRMAEIASMPGRVVAGSGSGRMFAIHGPGIHRELALLVEAGLTPAQALQAATARAAQAMGAADRIGMLKAGLVADLLLVDGNPLRDITDTERISAVFFRGERIVRAELFEEEE